MKEDDAFVLDASIAVKCFFNEDGTGACLEILNYITFFYAPEFFLTEIESAITKKVRRREADVRDALVKKKQMRKMPFRLISYDKIHNFAFELATEYFISLYDACYLAVAIDNRATLYTADIRFFNAVSSTAFSDNIEKVNY